MTDAELIARVRLGTAQPPEYGGWWRQGYRDDSRDLCDRLEAANADADASAGAVRAIHRSQRTTQQRAILAAHDARVKP